ncbi:PAS domain-containing protein [Patulibacter sp.]|uniref:PAS domain-containing protein n=1 Tax=Patulibacter sp. TaxID=1912859 RepID=UPI002723201C|nr:PAS domain-containing protein [Patulibacter sp.]MDO9410902.1 PAS domain-containing protein [Patulibacter sp.]
MSAALDAVPDHVVVLGEDGRILHTNAAWRRFARENGGDRDWTGVDYLAVGDDGPDDGRTDDVSRGIREVVEGRRERFEHEYDCHAPDRLRWFRLTATRVGVAGVGAVVAHTDVSRARTTAAVLGSRATHDALTGVLTGEAIESHARQMVAEGRGVTVVRVRLEDEPSRDRDADLARAASTLQGLFPAPAMLGRTDHGLVVVQGGETDDELLEALGTTYGALAAGFPDLHVTITGERLSRGSGVRPDDGVPVGPAHRVATPAAETPPTTPTAARRDATPATRTGTSAAGDRDVPDPAAPAAEDRASAPAGRGG